MCLRLKYRKKIRVYTDYSFGYVHDLSQPKHCAVDTVPVLQLSFAWFPALRFRSSVQIGSSSIFSVPVRYTVRQRRYGTAVWTRLRKRLRMNGNQALFLLSLSTSAVLPPYTLPCHSLLRISLCSMVNTGQITGGWLEGARSFSSVASRLRL